MISARRPQGNGYDGTGGAAPRGDSGSAGISGDGETGKAGRSPLSCGRGIMNGTRGTLCNASGRGEGNGAAGRPGGGGGRQGAEAGGRNGRGAGRAGGRGWAWGRPRTRADPPDSAARHRGVTATLRGDGLRAAPGRGKGSYGRSSSGRGGRGSATLRWDCVAPLRWVRGTGFRHSPGADTRDGVQGTGPGGVEVHSSTACNIQGGRGGREKIRR